MGQHFQGERPQKGISVADELVQAFQRFLVAAGIRSAATYTKDVLAFQRLCAESGTALLEAKLSDVDEFRTTLLVQGMSRGGVNNVTNHLKRFYRWAYKRRLAASDLLFGYKGLSTGRSLPKTILSVAEMGKFLRMFALRTPRDLMLKTMVELLYGSALRISEVETLRHSDIDFASGVILIHERKTLVTRKVPASQASLDAVNYYLEHAWRSCTTPQDQEASYLYPQKGATTLRCLLNRKLSHECGRLGLKRISTHSFRHSAATHLLQSGAGIRQVQAFLGHKSIGSTQRYTHVITQDLKAVVEACHPRETSA